MFMYFEVGWSSVGFQICFLYLRVNQITRFKSLADLEVVLRQLYSLFPTGQQQVCNTFVKWSLVFAAYAKLS